jgi:hypothetical protein
MLRSSIIAAQESEAALGFGGAFFRYTNRKDVERDILLRPSMMFSCFWGLAHTYIRYTLEAAFTSPPNPKYFLLHTSYQIFQRMHGALNVGKKDN